MTAIGSGCGSDSVASVAIRIHQPPPLDSTGQCPFDPPPIPLSRGPDGPTTLRMTYRRSGGGTLLCDVIIPLEGPSRVVGVPRGMADRTVDLLVEAFRGDVSQGAVLVGSGEALGADLEAGGEILVSVAPRDEFRCTDQRLKRGRAFHSATTLPNGRVLLVGGVVPNPNDPAALVVDQAIEVAGSRTGGFYATASVELYDPQRGSFTEVNVPGLGPRAFHEAYLIAETPDGGFPVLLVGGVTVAGDPAQNPVIDGIRENTAVQPLRVVPAPNATGAPTEILTIFPDDRPATRVEVDTNGFAPRIFAAAMRPPSGGDDPNLVAQIPPLLAGGYSDYGTRLYYSTFEQANLMTGTSVGDASWQIVPGARVGGTVTRLSDDRALLWGGNLGSAAMAEGTEAGALISGLSGGAPGSALATFDPLGVLPAARAFHAATPLGGDRVLVTGGFSVAGMSTGDPVGPFAQVVAVDAALGIAMTDLQPAGAVPVGYADAVPLLGGDVLITGGNPATGTAMAPCPDGSVGTHLCSVGTVFRYRAVTGTLEELAATPLLVDRWGHRSAVLLDGTVLLTGGFRFAADLGGTKQLSIIREGELYNPRTEALDPAADNLEGLPPRLPGDIARNTDGTPFSECPVVDVAP